MATKAPPMPERADPTGPDTGSPLIITTTTATDQPTERARAITSTMAPVQDQSGRDLLCPLLSVTAGRLRTYVAQWFSSYRVQPRKPRHDPRPYVPGARSHARSQLCHSNEGIAVVTTGRLSPLTSHSHHTPTCHSLGSSQRLQEITKGVSRHDHKGILGPAVSEPVGHHYGDLPLWALSLGLIHPRTDGQGSVILALNREGQHPSHSLDVVTRLHPSLGSALIPQASEPILYGLTPP